MNNTAVDADSIILVSVVDYAGSTGGPIAIRTDNLVAGTTFDIVVSNLHATVALNGVYKIGFRTVLKGEKTSLPSEPEALRQGVVCELLSRTSKEEKNAETQT